MSAWSARKSAPNSGTGADARAAQLEQDGAALASRTGQTDRMRAEEQHHLESLAGLTAEQARSELLARLEAELETETAVRLRKAQEDARATAESQARDILTAAIQRHAADQVSDVTTTPVPLPDESMKGRIIGREGRNIRALEMATGVTVIIDDSPELVVLSSFDPIRREIARVVLERLMADGRINPALIEETTDKVASDLDALILKAGEEAAEALRLAPVPLDILRLLGRLKFRTSFSQNVLRHSMEAARLAGLMAPEIGLDPETARRAALFHDLGKAVDHEVEGRHAEIGADLLRKAGESETIVEAVRGHHDGPEPGSAYAALVAAADAVTAACPARGRKPRGCTSSGSRTSRRSPGTNPAWSAVSPCRPAGSCGCSWSRRKWTTPPPSSWRGGFQKNRRRPGLSGADQGDGDPRNPLRGICPVRGEGIEGNEDSICRRHRRRARADGDGARGDPLQGGQARGCGGGQCREQRGGTGITAALAEELLAGGADLLTMGDHVWDSRWPCGFDQEPRIVRAEPPAGLPRKGEAACWRPRPVPWPSCS